MTKKMRTVDAEAVARKLKSVYCAECNATQKVQCSACWVNDVLELPEGDAVDAVEVVRCKDCERSALPAVLTQKYGEPGTLTCHNWKSPCNKRNVRSDGFCPYGERKDND